MKTNKELEQLEAEGKTCKDCNQYSTCHMKRNKHLELPLCLKFEIKRGGNELITLEFTEKQILGLIPAQALVDFNRAKEVLEKVAKAQAKITAEEILQILDDWYGHDDVNYFRDKYLDYTPHDGVFKYIKKIYSVEEK